MSLLMLAIAKVQLLPTLPSLLMGLVGVLLIWLYRGPGKTNDSMIPGPFRLPFFGSVFYLAAFLSNKRRHQMRVDLAEKYGKIYALHIGPIQMVHLNDVDLIKEAFITKAEIFSDRPQPKRPDPTSDLFGRGKGIVDVNYGKDFKERKTLILHSIKDFGFGGKTLEDTAAEEVAFLIQRFADVADSGIPTDIHQRLIHLSVSNVICSVVFGKRFSFDDEPFNAAVEGIRFLLSSPSPIVRLEGMPLLRHLPVVKRLKAEVNRHRRNAVDFVERQIQLHKEEFDVHCPKDFIDLALQKAELDKEQKSKIGTDNIKKIILDLFFAGDLYHIRLRAAASDGFGQRSRRGQ